VSAPNATIDLDDVDGLLAADREGLLRAASMAGAQMRAIASALDEGLLDALRSDLPPRTVSWVATRGTASTAGVLLGSALGGSMAAPFVLAAEVPPWIGALDVLVVAGDDPADPALVAAAATGIRRGARVVIVAPDEGPLREVAAGRSVVLGPRLVAPADFGLMRFLAAGLAVLRVIDPGMQVDVAALADDLDAETLRNSAGRESFTNPAKRLAERISGRRLVLAGDNAATLALARHGCAMMLRIGLEAVAAVELSDALVAVRGGLTGRVTDFETSLFHDEELDGPLPARVRTVVLTTGDERSVLAARLSGFDDIDVISAEDVPDVATPAVGGRPEQQLALMAVRLEMAAVYLRLARG
jgi:hypothetical protein